VRPRGDVRAIDVLRRAKGIGGRDATAESPKSWPPRSPHHPGSRDVGVIPTRCLQGVVLLLRASPDLDRSLRHGYAPRPPTTPPALSRHVGAGCQFCVRTIRHHLFHRTRRPTCATASRPVHLLSSVGSDASSSGLELKSVGLTPCRFESDQTKQRSKSPRSHCTADLEEPGPDSSCASRRDPATGSPRSCCERSLRSNIPTS
jgi:hypothetical protein